MKILIAYSQRELKKQKYAISNTLSFSENLSKYCNVQLVNVDDEDFGLFEASSLLEKFLPDIIHCCDPKSFFTFRYFRKIFYRSERLYSSESAQTKKASKSSCRSEVSCNAIRYDEIMPLKYASLCAFNNKETLLKTLKTIKECAGILIDENQNARTFIKKHLFYYYQIILHSNAELFASYNFYSSINFFKTKTFLENKKNDLEEKESLKIFNYFSSLPAKKVRKIKQKSILILSDFQIQEKLKKTLSKTFPKIEYISYFQFMNHNLFFPCECLPFFDKSYDITIYSTSYRRKKDKKRLLSELKRISTNSFLKLSVQSDKIEEIKII